MSPDMGPLMQAVGFSVLFAVDAALVAWTAWLAVCAAGLDRRGLIEATLGWMLLAVVWIACSGEMLGSMGGFGRVGFLTFHAVVLVGWIAGRRADLRVGAASARRWSGDWRNLLTSGTKEGTIVLGLMLVLGALLAIATRAEPVVFDALTYRLSRIGAWLQDGWIRHYATDDPRLNYMPAGPDVVIAWLLGAASDGFYLAPVAQGLGGLLLLGATFGLARLAGLSQLAALGAVTLVLGMANVAVQFTTIQSDLFTAGVFAASYCLWHRALQRGEGSWVAGMGIALAFGSKGTLFYLAPGAACWAGWLAWQHRRSGLNWWPTAAGLIAASVILLLPGYWRNQVTYGSVFGPRDAVVLHHGSVDSIAQLGEKLVRNTGTSAVQLFEPTAQPFWLQAASRSVAEKLARQLPTNADPYVFIGQSRREQIDRVLALTEPDADVVTCGLLGVGAFIVGGIAALFRAQRPGATQIAVWCAGVVVYLLVQHALVQWHHWAFRFTVVAAPWVAVIGAWGLCALPKTWRLAIWTVVVVSAVDVFANVQLRANQAAWQAWTRPERAFSYYQYSHWRAWFAELDRPDQPIRVAFPIDRPLAAFFRTSPPRSVEITALSGLTAPTAEAAAGGSWLVVPLERYQGNEGRVFGRTNPAFGLAAYRALEPGESPRPMLYRLQVSEVGDRRRCELLVRTWGDAPLRLEMMNPGIGDSSFEVRADRGTVTDTLPAGARRVVEVPAGTGLIPVVLEFSPPTSAAGGRLNLVIRIAP